MREKGIKKEPSSSAIEVNDKVQEFVVGEIDHVQVETWMVSGLLARHVQLDEQLVMDV